MCSIAKYLINIEIIIKDANLLKLWVPTPDPPHYNIYFTRRTKFSLLYMQGQIQEGLGGQLPSWILKNSIFR
jgi:hypothetical protein